MLGSSFSEGRNSLNAIRLVLAALVIVSHSWWLGGYGAEPHPGGLKLGSWAVMAFFGISGFLITRSRAESLSAAAYWRARFLRIFPGLVVCVAVVAFVIAPLATAVSGRRYSLPDAVLYFLSNLSAGTPRVAVPGIPGSLNGLPDPYLWNGPLWTLFWEIVCYVLIGMLFSIFRVELVRVALLVLFLLGTAAAFAVDAGLSRSPVLSDWPLIPVLTFLAGSLAYLFRDSLPAGIRAVAGCSALVVVIASLGFGSSLSHIPLVIVLLAGSLLLPLSAVGSRYDVSYGVYIYGWPVQQFLASLGLHTAVPPLIFAATALLCVAPLAWLSCRFIEVPMRRRRKARGAPEIVSKAGMMLM
ncbi:acyltransferase family protein [Arthrobacter rhizosphaerae]|uniref:acyltransferase family protein n=1 Tax=Arthrobacter rhizosphaerae TaxID=2855490 RepID=UPI001FF1E85B|nr:acyltransferase [Arthrobacter rhizosphaerae]